MSLVEEWKKRDPLLSDLEGFLRLLERVQRFQELHSQLTTWHENGGGPKEIKMFRGISAIFALKDRGSPQRYGGLSYIPVSDLLAFDGLKEKLEAGGDLFLCFEVMHEETLDHDPERPHVRGTFSKYTYYDCDWEPVAKPEFMKKIEEHLRKVSEWYNRGAEMTSEPYPTPPLWRGENEPG